jgi:hypothetical protein
MKMKKERVRFELTELLGSFDFKSNAIDHSAISPIFVDFENSHRKTTVFMLLEIFYTKNFQ